MIGKISVIRIGQCYRIRYFRERVSDFNQSEARKNRFLDSDWLKLETLPRKYRSLSCLKNKLFVKF